GEYSSDLQTLPEQRILDHRGIVLHTDPVPGTEPLDFLEAQQEHPRDRDECEDDVETHARADEGPRRQAGPHASPFARRARSVRIPWRLRGVLCDHHTGLHQSSRAAPLAVWLRTMDSSQVQLLCSFESIA